MFKTLGWPELVIVLVIVLLVFGVGRIGKVAGELGKGIRAFKDGISGEENDFREPEEEINDKEK